MAKTIIISDYDETIVEFSGVLFDAVFNAVLGKDGYSTMINICNRRKAETGRSCDFLSGYIEECNLTKDEAEKLWSDFKNTEVYKELKSSKIEKVQAVLEKGNHIPEKNATAYYIEELLIPIVAVYNVLVKKIVPHEAFFELYEKSKENGDIFLINTFKNQKLIETELKEYVTLNAEKYNAFQELLDNKMVFGTTVDSCKGDDDRIEILLKKLNKDKNSDLILMGDGFPDVVNFEQALAINENSKFCFVNSRLNLEIKNYTSQIKALEEDTDDYKTKKAKLEKFEKELEKISQYQSKAKEGNFMSGDYKDLAKALY